MTKSELIEIMANNFSHLPPKKIEESVKEIVELMSKTLSNNQRIEIRGFGSFSLRYRSPRVGRNPKTGESVSVAQKVVPHFKPGKELKERVDFQ